MNNKKLFTKECKDDESAVQFAEKVGGKRTYDNAVEFLATYSISKALYNVKTDMYRVYIRIRPVCTCIALTYTVCKKTSKEVYEEARKKVQKGVL